MAGDYHQEKKQQEAELISHFPPWKWTTSDWQVYRNNRNAAADTTPPPPLMSLAGRSLADVLRRNASPGCSVKMKRFSLLGFCPLNLPLFCPRAHFASFTGGQTATWIQLCNVDCGVVRPASGADEWGIDKIDCAWQQQQVAQCCYVSTYVIIQRRMSVIFYVFKGPPRRSPRKTGSEDRWSILACTALYCMLVYVCFVYACRLVISDSPKKKKMRMRRMRIASGCNH